VIELIPIIYMLYGNQTNQLIRLDHLFRLMNWSDKPENLRPFLINTKVSQINSGSE